MSAPAPVITPELRSLLRAVKLGQLMATLPERLALARARDLSHAEFLELILSDEVTRRDATSAPAPRPRRRPGPGACGWRTSTTPRKSATTRHVLDELFSLRFVARRRQRPHHGPGRGRQDLPRHRARPRRRPPPATASTSNAPASCSNDSRPPGSTTATTTEIRKLLRADLLILDDFCLQPMDTADTADIYEIIVERHRTAATIITSNREPVEWLALMADPLLAQSAIDRLQSAAYELVTCGTQSCN